MKPIVKLQHVNKYFNKRKSNELHVLNNIELSLPNQGLVMLLGPSGSGKTTLLNVIGGLDKFDQGEIQVTEAQFKSYQARKWDHVRNYHIGYIFQNYHLMRGLSVYDNVAYPLRLMGIQDEKLIEEKVHYVLQAVNMFQFRKKNALQLSGGQQQRVAIARAVVKDPEIIIADEPTGNLDSQNTVEVMTMLKQIAQDKLVLMVTHERELAQFYGDRIIEIKDGQVISDNQDHERGDFAFKYDETIYLKDLKHHGMAQSNHNISIYEDDKNEMPIEAMLVVKNDTVYIKMSSSIKKVKMIDEHSTIQIKDEHAKTAQEKLISHTTFDKEKLLLPVFEKKHSFMFSLKQAVMMALEKIFNTTKKGKIMLFSFLLAGAVVAYAASSIAAVLFVSPEPFMPIQRDYYDVDVFTELPESDVETLYINMLDIAGEDGYINTLGQATLNFIAPNNSLYNVSIRAQLDLIDFMDYPIIYGVRAISDDEIMISNIMADTLVETSNGQDAGIWSYDHLIHETLRYGSKDYTIAGIVKSDIPSIFVSRTTANQMKPAGSVYASSLISTSDISYGASPLSNQYLIPESEALVFGFDASEVTYPFDISVEGKTITVSGTHDLDNRFIYVEDTFLESLRFYNNYFNFFVYNTNDILSSLTQVLPEESSVTDVYEQASENVTAQQQLVAVSTYTTAGVVIGIAALGFYFVIRSSLTKRQYDIAIMRAIGVYKRDIFRAFTVEILILTTVSTMIGYGLGTYAFSLLSDSLLGEINLFKVTFLSVIGGIVAAYVINVIAGLLPVWRLLRKTPAQILSQYDM